MMICYKPHLYIKVAGFLHPPVHPFVCHVLFTGTSLRTAIGSASMDVHVIPASSTQPVPLIRRWQLNTITRISDYLTVGHP